MNAVIKTGGKQYLVQEGQVLSIEKLEAKEGEKVSFDVLMKFEGEKVEIGTPDLSSKVEAEVIEQGRAKKVEVVHYKAKIRYRKRSGHRQPYTMVKIVKIA